MKQLLLICAVAALVGCGTTKVGPNAPANINDFVLEREVREELSTAFSKFKGELTNADLEKVFEIDLNNTSITDACLKEVAKLQKLEGLFLRRTQVTKAGVAELKKALPNCYISSP